MFAAVANRLAQSFLVLLGVAFLSFAMFTQAGDPVSNLLPQDASLQEREALRSELGLDQPFVIQFAVYVGKLVQGDLGISYRWQQPVSELIWAKLPATLELVLAATFIVVAVGVPVGIYCAVRRNSPVARGLLVASLVGVSTPTFVIGIMLIVLFSVHLQWLPSFGRGRTLDLGVFETSLMTADGWRSVLLPATTLALFQVAIVVRLVRSEMISVLGSDFIQFAHARGVGALRITIRHGLANALPPILTILGLQLGGLLVFSIVTEQVFQWPGIGLLFLQAIRFADIPMMTGYLLFAAVVFVVTNLLVDLVSLATDPRLRES